MNDLQATTNLLESRIDKLTAALVKNYEKKYPTMYGQLTFEVRLGTKYYKIIEVVHAHSNSLGPSRSVHAFVSKQTGAMYKPASYSSPAKGVRYNLLDDTSFEDCIHDADYGGGYLYMR